MAGTIRVGFATEEGAIYCGRAHNYRQIPGSPLGNPFVMCKYKGGWTRQQVIQMYHRWLALEWRDNPEGEAATELRRLLELYRSGADLLLGCWCRFSTKQEPGCHCDIIKLAIEKLYEKDS